MELAIWHALNPNINKTPPKYRAECSIAMTTVEVAVVCVMCFLNIVATKLLDIAASRKRLHAIKGIQESSRGQLAGSVFILQPQPNVVTAVWA